MKYLILCGLFLMFYAQMVQPALGGDFQYDDHGKRDPFVSASELGSATDGASLASLKLEGIIQDGNGSSAMISGEIVQMGDELSGFYVQEIKNNMVVLEKGGELFNLQMRDEEPSDGPSDSRQQTGADDANEPDDKSIQDNKGNFPAAANDIQKAMEEDVKKLQLLTKNKQDADRQ